MKSGMCPTPRSTLEIEKQKRSSQGIIWCIFTIYSMINHITIYFGDRPPPPHPSKIIEKHFLKKKAKKMQLPPPPPRNFWTHT